MYLIIGFTHSDRDRDYSSFCDGWRPEARQTRIGVRVPESYGLENLDGALWAEAVYIATNAPIEVIQSSPSAAAVYQALTRRPVTPKGLRSLSVGDTVLVGGALFSCERVGFLPRTTVLLDGQTSLLAEPVEVCEF